MVIIKALVLFNFLDTYPSSYSRNQSPTRPQLMQRLKSSLRSKDSNSRVGCSIPQSVSFDETATASRAKLSRQRSLDLPRVRRNAASMPNLRQRLPQTAVNRSCGEIQYSLQDSGTVSLRSDSTLTANSQGFIPSESYEPVIPPGGGRLRYIDSILSEDILMSNSRTLQSITENAGKTALQCGDCKFYMGC